MDDTTKGTSIKQGDLTQNEPLEHAPIWAFPLRPPAVLKWLPGPALTTLHRCAHGSATWFETD